MMGGLGLDDEDVDDDDLEAMLSQMPPGMFEQMLREDAGKGGAAGEEADALLSMLSQPLPGTPKDQQLPPTPMPISSLALRSL